MLNLVTEKSKLQCLCSVESKDATWTSKINNKQGTFSSNPVDTRRRMSTGKYLLHEKKYYSRN